MDKSSLKSSNIRGRFLHLVSRKGDLHNRVHAFMRGQFLPVLVFVGLHLVEAGIFADNLVHALLCSTGPLLLQRRIYGEGSALKDAYTIAKTCGRKRE